MIAGWTISTSGSITLFGEEVTDRPAYRRPVNTVFQRYALFPHMNVHDNVSFGLRMQKVAKDEISNSVPKRYCGWCAWKRWGIAARRNFRVDNNRPRGVGAGVGQQAITMLDEPLGALDLKLRQAMQRELKRIQQEVGITLYAAGRGVDDVRSHCGDERRQYLASGQAL